MKHKCLCSILLILTMLSTCWTYSVAEEMSDAFTSGDYEYIILDDGTVKIQNTTVLHKSLLFRIRLTERRSLPLAIVLSLLAVHLLPFLFRILLVNLINSHSLVVVS